jgi:ribonuclease R
MSNKKSSDSKFKISRQDIINLLKKFPNGFRIGQLEQKLSLSRRKRGFLKDLLNKLKKSNITITAGGTGFVKVMDEDTDDVFVHKNDVAGALDGDTVAVSTWSNPRGQRGKVEKIIEHSRKKLTGTIKEKGRGRFLLDTDDNRIARAVYFNKNPNRKYWGKLVLANIIKYPDRVRAPVIVEALEVLGEPDLLDTQIRKNLIMAGVQEEFPNQVIKELSNEIPDEAGEIRQDLTHMDFFTIDPEDARDFDDAVCIVEKKGHFHLSVAIADVSHWVRPGTALDEEALNRGQSIYLPHKAIPMLPEKLSGNLCSLKPEVERKVGGVHLVFDKDGNRKDYTLYFGTIRSRKRFAYKDIAKMVKKQEYSGKIGDQVKLLAEFTEVLHKKRLHERSLELDIPEAKIILEDDDVNRIKSITKAKPDEWMKKAYNMVEECMLAANEAVGSFAKKRKLPVPWRIHEAPKEEKIEEFYNFSRTLGVKFNKNKGSFIENINKHYDEMKKHPASKALFFGVLRSLRQASYSQNNLGHFALGSENYLHFTSPIRRYADLIVHRAMKYYLLNGDEEAGKKYSKQEISAIAAQISQSEQKTVKLERKINDIFKAYYMVPLIGDVFYGTVESVTEFGLFLSLQDPFVEGLVRYEWIQDDTAVYNPDSGVATGLNTGKRIMPGSTFPVLVAGAEIASGKISFEPVDKVFTN